MENLNKYKKLLSALQKCNDAIAEAELFHPGNSCVFSLKYLDEELGEVICNLEEWLEENEND